MNAQFVYAISTVVALGILCLCLPLVTPKGIFFSAAVHSEFPRSKTGRRLLASFRWQVLSFVLVAVLVAVYIGPAHAAARATIPVAILIAGAWLAYWRKCREISAKFDRKEAEEATAPEPMGRDILLWLALPPFVGLAAAGLWRGLQERILAGLALCAVMLALAWIISTIGRRTVMRYVTARALQVVLYPIACSFIMTSLSVAVPFWIEPLILLGTIGGVFYWAYLKISAHSSLDAPSEDSHWHGGLFYANPADPAIFVPKRLGVGYTLNMSNKWSWVVLMLIVILLFIPMILRHR